MPGVGWECHLKGDDLGRPAEKVTLKQRPEDVHGGGSEGVLIFSNGSQV